MENNTNEKPPEKEVSKNEVQDKNTSLGLEENLESLLCYLFGWVTGLIFLLAEKKNKFVKFHAIQSLVLGAAVMVVYFILDIMLLSVLWHLWALISLLTTLLGIGYTILSIFLMVKAYKKETFQLPLIGPYAEKAANK